ncbi:MAG: hypothetical protein ED557_03975 [Balneola sp.]|nr:MAG: hypothetical protein ED557_03975 [Balneola sp.]
MKNLLTLFCLIFSFSSLSQSISAQGVFNRTIENDKDAEKLLIDYYFNRSLDLGVKHGEELFTKYSDSPKVGAWYTALLARNEEVDSSVEIANTLKERFPNNPWTSFAETRALGSSPEKRDSVASNLDMVVQLHPNNEYFHWLKAVILSNVGKKEESSNYIDSLSETEFKNSIILLSLKGSNLLSSNFRSEEQEGMEKFEEGLQIFEEIRAEHPDWVDAYYLPAYYLNLKGQRDEPFELLEQIVYQTNSYRVHSFYWRLLTSNDKLTKEEKFEKIQKGTSYIDENGYLGPKFLFGLSSTYGGLGDKEKRFEYEERVLNEYPNHLNTEWVLVERYRTYSRENLKAISEDADPEVISNYEEMLWEFVNKPFHIRETLLGDAYRELFHVSQFKEKDAIVPETLLEIVEGMILYEGINPHITYARAPVFLSETTEYFERAKEIVREGIPVAIAKIEGQNERNVYKTEEDYQRSLSWMQAIMYDALGWINFQEGILDSAEIYLSRAYSLNSENSINLNRLGQLNEFIGNLDKAESYYKKGLKIESMGVNPNIESIKALYIQRNGSEELFEDYLANIKNEGEIDKMQEVLSEYMKNGDSFPGFELKDLSNNTFELNDLKGKIVILNVWGLWCGPCVQEMPDIQLLHEKYEKDSEVVVVTINNDPSIDKVKEWMDEEDYDFVVLRDDGFLAQQKIYVFPTTWFLDHNSEIKFIKEGYTKNLVEEYTWRIDYIANND